MPNRLNCLSKDPTYIGQIERGEKNLTVDVLYRILKALNVRQSDFFELIDGDEEEGNERQTKNTCLLRLMEMDTDELILLTRIADILNDYNVGTAKKTD